MLVVPFIIPNYPRPKMSSVAHQVTLSSRMETIMSKLKKATFNKVFIYTVAMTQQSI